MRKGPEQPCDLVPRGTSLTLELALPLLDPIMDVKRLAQPITTISRGSSRPAHRQEMAVSPSCNSLLSVAKIPSSLFANSLQEFGASLIKHISSQANFSLAIPDRGPVRDTLRKFAAGRE